MLYGFVGTLHDTDCGSIRGNGKTLTMTYYLYQDFLNGRKIVTNYHTTFSQKVGVQDIVNMVLNGELKDVSIGIDEIQIVLNSIGTSAKVVNFVDKMVSQTRKIKADVYYTTQRYGNIHKRLRVQTDRIIRPYKVHKDMKICRYDMCEKDHIIMIKSEIPYMNKVRLALDAKKVGMLFNSNEIINEEIKV